MSGEGDVVVPADEAYVVLFLGYDGDGLPTVLSGRDTRDIEQSLIELGIEPVDLRLTSGSSFGGSSVQVRVDPAALPDAAEAVEQAVEDVVGRVVATGVHLVVRDCASELGPARRDAVAEARALAEGLAVATGVELGALIGVAETDDSFAYFGGADPCDAGAVGDGSELASYDAPLEVELSVVVAARFAIAGGGGPSALTAVGRGEVSVTADRATVVFVPDPDATVFGTPDSGERERLRLLQAFRDAGVDEGAVRFVALPFSGPGVQVLAVDVAVDSLPGSADDLADVVEDVRGTNGEAGVLFSSSTCRELLRQAQRDAVADADQRLTGLAEAAGIAAGGLSEVADLAGTGWVSGVGAEFIGSVSGIGSCD